ncbi:DUF5050 domain-containing protein [Marinilactibacillus psychrotolerans]|uniref:DUF5050 domain-containing protein n=1 Tax=Marinilactibacillus psychrotolerans TaxID=191770 RepID=UPI003887F938
MKKYLNWINIALRGTVLLFLPGLLIFYLFYKVIFDVEMDIYWLTILMALVTFIYDLIKKYQQETTEERLQTLDEIERMISKKRWEVLVHDRTKLVVRPKFDFPFNFMLSDQVEIQPAYSRVEISGPRLYIEEVSKEIRGEAPEDTDRKLTIRNVSFGIICAFFFFLPVVEGGVYWQAKVMYHNAFADKNEVVAQTEDILGNSAENILNQGIGVANEEYNFYVEDETAIVRTDKNYQNKEYLIEKEDSVYSDLNIVGDWLYYVEGTAISRIKTDGSDKEVIQNIDIPMDVQISGEWIYYISIEDESNVYRMNLNGENLERYLDVYANSIAVYEDYMILSYSEDEDDYKPNIERVNLKDKSREVQFDLVSTNLIEWDGYYYYTGANSKLMRVQIETPSNPEVLVDEYVTSFTITDQSLIYTVESTYDTKIYISNIDGSNEQRIPGKSSMVDGLTKLGDSVLFYTWNSNGYATVNRFDLNSNEVKKMNELVQE